MFLGAFEKLRKTTTIFVVCLSVRPSAWNNSSTTGRIFMKFDIWLFFESLFENFQRSLKSEKNDRYFTWKSVYFYDIISLNSSCNEKYFRQNCRKNPNTYLMSSDFFPANCAVYDIM